MKYENHPQDFLPVLLFLIVMISLFLNPSVIFADDHRDDFGSAKEVAISSMTNGILNKPGDRDYFKFAVSQTATYMIYARGNVNINGKLFNSAYQFITADNNCGNSVNLRITITLSPGTYYLEITAYNGTETGRYSFCVLKSSDSSNENEEGRPRNRSRFPENPKQYRPMPLPDKTKRPPKVSGENPEIPESHTIENRK